MTQVESIDRQTNNQSSIKSADIMYTKTPLTLIFALIINGCGESEQKTSSTMTIQKSNSQEIEITRKKLHADCTNNLEAHKSQYTELMKKKSYWEASRVANLCSNVLNNTELKSMASQAQILSYKKEILDKKIPLETRMKAIQSLARDYPEEGKLFMELESDLKSKIAAAENTAAKVAKKNSGVSIGMSQSDVLDSSWGKPERINKTTNKLGTREQWVYKNGNYLYFDGDILTTIQN